MDNNRMSKKIDRISFQLGMINCFAEMVACGVKKLAISPPISPEDYEVIGKLSDNIVKGFGIQSYLERSLLITDLQPEEFTADKWSILYYESEEILEEYLVLKEKKRQLERSGRYNREAGREMARAFMRLLSYPEDKTEEKLSKETPSSPYMLTDD